MALDRGTQTISDHPHQQCEVFAPATAETVWLTPAKSPVPYVSPPSAWHAVPMASLKPGDLFRLIRLEPPFDVIRTFFYLLEGFDPTDPNVLRIATMGWEMKRIQPPPELPDATRHDG